MAREKEKTPRRPLRLLSFWKDMDELRKNRIIGFCGLLTAALVLFTLLSCVSYLFTWRQDMSLLQDPGRMALSESVANWGGKLGAKWGYLLVYRWFGVGSFALVLLLVILSARMLGRKSFSLTKAVLLTLTGAVISSFVLAAISRIAGLDYIFGGGLGGRFGDYAIAVTANLVGLVTTCIFVLLLWCCGSSLPAGASPTGSPGQGRLRNRRNLKSPRSPKSRRPGRMASPGPPSPRKSLQRKSPTPSR